MPTPSVAEQRVEALARAENGSSLANYPAIFEGFMARGILEADIEPRVNVFTYRAWQARGRQVRRGERGVQVTTRVPMERRSVDASGEETVERFSRPKMATVFHITQTDASEGGGA